MSTQFIIYASNKASIANPPHSLHSNSHLGMRQGSRHRISAAPSSSYQTTRFILTLPLHAPILTLLSKRTILFKIHPQYSTELYTLVTHLTITDPQHKGLILFKGKPYL